MSAAVQSIGLSPFPRLIACVILVAASSSVTAASDDDFAYYNPADTYAPSDFVKYGHRLTNEDFQTSRDYIERVLYSPIVIFGLGFLAVFFLLVGLAFRCCYESCKCLPNPSSDTYKKDQLSNTVLFYLFCLLVLVIDQLVFLGNTELDKGVSTFADVVDSAKGIVNVISSNATALSYYGVVLNTEYQALNASCPAARSSFDDIPEYLELYNDSIDMLTSIVDPLDNHFDTVSDYMDLYAGLYRNIALYVIWGLAIAAIIFFLSAKWFSSIGFMKFSISFGFCVYLLYLILGVPWVVTTSLGADLCMDPSYNVIKSLPDTDSLRNVTVYYSTCVGSSELTSSVNEGIGVLYTLNESLATLTRYHVCPTDTDVLAMQQTTGEVIRTLEVLRDSAMACEPLQKLWFESLNTGLCDQLYTGIFYIWGSQLVTSFFLFCLILTATFTFHYFESTAPGKNGKVVPLDDHGESGDYELEDDDDDEQQRGRKKKRKGSSQPAAAELIEVDAHVRPTGKHA